MAPGDKALHDLCVPAGVDGDVGNALSGVSGCKRASRWTVSTRSCSICGP